MSSGNKKTPSFYGNLGFKTQGLGLRTHTNLNLGSGLSFSENRRFQDGLIHNRGETVIHETAISCMKCRRGGEEDQLVGNVFCSTCNSDGWLYRNPRYIQGLITDITASRDISMYGILEPGDCTLSPSSSLFPPITDFDKITFTWPQAVSDGEIMVRGAAYQRQVKRGGTQWLSEDQDRLNYEGVHSIHVEDENEVEYYEDNDFIFEGKTIRWIGRTPAVRTRFVIKYLAHLEWIVFTPVKERRDVGVNMGSKVLLRRRHIVHMSDDPMKETASEKASDGSSIFGGKVVI